MPSSDVMLGHVNSSLPDRLRLAHHVPDICEVDFFGLASFSSSAATVLLTLTPTVKHDRAHVTGSSDDGHPHKKIKFNDGLRDKTELEVTTKVPDPAHDSIDIDDTPGHYKSKNIDDSQKLSDPYDPFNVHGESLTVDDPPPFKKRKIDDPSHDDIS